ncbi:amidohydrolase family protein [Streptomyces rubradiris]|uniref:amidohydrolase family protein n=1 Tax=Streptomyces rubradiris TaxID=285531 RepID=UPI00340DE830
MDENQIATSVLSLTAPRVVGWQGQERRGMARRVNEYVAEPVTRHQDRFGNFATVPLPDVEGAVAEAEYALDELAADGVVLLSNYEGVYLGDPKYAPLWEALNRRSAVVFIHPGHPLIPLLSDVPGPLVDYPFDTTRNAVQLVFTRVLDRYWDTALSSGPDAFPSSLTFADHERILFGSDFPYAPAPVAAAFTRLLDTHSGLTDEQRTAFDHGNARKILARLS